jgi:signal transduction histidine kinase
MKTLVVDDEPLSLMLFEEQIRTYGHEVTPCENAITALEAYHKTFYPLIVLDLGLPGMDGLELCRRIRSLPQGDQSIILVVTARDTPEDLQAVLDAGADDYLIKPVSQKHLNIRLTILERQIQLLVQRRQAEEERHKLEVQLRQSERLKALGILAGGIAHDFNNILGTMLGYTELLLDKYPENSHEKEYLEQVYQAGERATDLVEQILTFSHSQEQILKPTDISPIIEEALKMMRATIPANIDIRQHLQPNCHPILADATQIHQVIINLCVNAFHAMRDQGGTLDVTLKETNHDTDQGHILGLTAGSYLKLTVSDTGCGMTLDVQEHIFEPFFTTKEIGEGAGLGLSVVHGIVKGHHGAIAVESKPGKGTTCQIFFPTTDEVKPQKKSSQIIPVEKGKEHILIVEDETALAKLYEIALTKLGYQVTIFTDSHEALERFHASPDQFDVVFTDQAMHGMTGAQLSQELLHIRADLPIILSTGYSETISEEEARALGIRQFLKKPVKFSVLAKTVREVLALKTQE